MSGEVFVVLQDRDGSVHPVAAEAVTAAKELASALGTTAEAIALGGSGKLTPFARSLDPQMMHLTVENDGIASETQGARRRNGAGQCDQKETNRPAGENETIRKFHETHFIYLATLPYEHKAQASV